MRNFRIIWCVVLCLLSNISSLAIDVTIDNISYSLNMSDRTASVTGSTLEHVVVPETIVNDGMTFVVTSIERGAFTYNTIIKSIKTGNSLKSINSGNTNNWAYINYGAFSYATNLQDAYFGDNLETIGAGAFYGASNLSKIYVGKKLRRIEHVAFKNCKSLQYIIIPSSINYILTSDNCFAGCSQLHIICLREDYDTGCPIQTSYPSSFITFSNTKYDYSGKIPNVNYTYNGIGHGFQITNINSDALEATVGKHTSNLHCTLTNSDMSFDVDIPYTYTINPAKLTAKVNDAARQYGDANQQFSSTYTGFVNNEDASVITSHGSYSTTASAKSDVGTYNIKQSGAQAQNYTFEYEDGTLTVNKAPLTMSANNKSMTYGNSVPTLDAKYEGLKNNETQPVWTTAPVFATTAKQTSSVGTYPITISNAVAKNYEVTINNGTLTVEKANLTVRANNSSRQYGETNPQFTLSYTGLKNNESVPQWENLPRVQSSATLQSPVGTYPITISDAVAVNYNLSTVNGTLTVNKAPLQITPKDVTRKYGENNPEFELSYIGLKNNEYAPEWTTSPILSTQATKTSPVGDYSVQVTSAEARNYTLEKKVGKLTITKAPLTVGVNSYSRKYGAVNPQFDLYYTGLRNNETIPEWTTQPTISTTATQKSDVGNYAITATGGAMRNYEVTTINSGVLTITPASLTVKANNTSRLYFEDNPEFTFSCIGFVGNDNSSALTVKPQIKTAATKNSKVGLYAIEICNAQSKNYTLSYENGQLTINKRQLTVSTKNYTRAYGEENPLFELNYAGFVNNDNENSLISKPKVTTNATTSSDVGSYNINISNGVAENYEFTYIGGKLTIEKAYQTLTWDQDLSNVNQYDQIELTAKASSGLGITYAVEGSPVCSIFKIGNKQYLDCNSGGEAVIVAIQEGNKNYWQTTKMYKPIVIKSATGNIKYNLTYIIDGETYKKVMLESGAQITPEASPTKEGYTFSGWSTIPQTMPAYDVTVTGSFTINKYKLTYMLDNNIYKEVWYNYGAAIVMEPVPQGNYASFERVDLITSMPAHDVVVNARYTISDNPNMIDGHEYVDLGLPSGKCWATMNYGASSPEDYGTYLWWDNNSIISSNWGSGWTTPSLEDIRELEKKCTWRWGSINGYNGYTITGKNGNSIFFPACGFKMDGQSSANKVGEWVYYWTSTPFSEDMANIILSTSSSVWFGEMNITVTKLPIRPITKESQGSIPATYTITYWVDDVFYKSFELKEGEQIIPEPAPIKDGYTFNGWSSIPETMPAHYVTVTGSFTINKYKLTYMLDNEIYKEVWCDFGAKIVPEPTPQGNYSSFEWVDLITSMPAHDVVVNARYTISDNPNINDEHEFIDLGLPSGLLWATMNVGATKPEDSGSYFSWGETTPKSEYSVETYKYAKGTWNTLTKYCYSSKEGIVDRKYVLEEEDDAASANWGKPWRTPTYNELMELHNNCTWTVDWMIKGLAKRGYNVTGPNGNSIYIPVSGYMLDDIVNGEILFYCLMSASLGEYYSETARILTDIDQHWYRFYGYNVRPVRSKNVNQINDAFNDENDSIKAIYDIRGNKRANLQKGINIVVYHNGTSRKVIR